MLPARRYPALLFAVLLSGVCILAMREAPPPLTPAVGRLVAAVSVPAAAEASVCLNTATGEELMELPGLGQTLAARILRYREAHNGFDCPEELLQVKGVSTGRLNSWAPYLTVGIYAGEPDPAASAPG